jgi:hypothetical protein
LKKATEKIVEKEDTKEKIENIFKMGDMMKKKGKNVKIMKKEARLLVESSDVREIRKIYEAEFKICSQVFLMKFIVESLCQSSCDDGLDRLYTGRFTTLGHNCRR